MTNGEMGKALSSKTLKLILTMIERRESTPHIAKRVGASESHVRNVIRWPDKYRLVAMLGPDLHRKIASNLHHRQGDVHAVASRLGVDLESVEAVKQSLLAQGRTIGRAARTRWQDSFRQEPAPQSIAVDPSIEIANRNIAERLGVDLETADRVRANLWKYHEGKTSLPSRLLAPPPEPQVSP